MTTEIREAAIRMLSRKTVRSFGTWLCLHPPPEKAWSGLYALGSLLGEPAPASANIEKVGLWLVAQFPEHYRMRDGIRINEGELLGARDYDGHRYYFGNKNAGVAPKILMRIR
jgi:hypothetical protein